MYLQVTARRPPACVWNYPKRREKFDHLTRNTPCLCGAGKWENFKKHCFDDILNRVEAFCQKCSYFCRDISFLYDATKIKEPKHGNTKGHVVERTEDESGQTENKEEATLVSRDDALLTHLCHVSCTAVSGPNLKKLHLPEQPLKLPETLIPDEYHIVKNKGVMGPEYHDEWVAPLRFVFISCSFCFSSRCSVLFK